MSDYIFEKLSIKINGIEKLYNVPKINECPYCNNGIAPHVVSVSETDMEERTFSITAQCPRCGKYFVMPYKLPFGTKIPELIEYEYKKELNISLPIELENVSKRFVRMYKESLMAESYDFNEIAGIGFRKSIEFLVRDYLIDFKNLEKIEILNLSLEEAINRISDIKLVKLALSYKWLKYDSFSRSFFNKQDIENMKDLINIFIKYINYKVSVKSEK